MQLPENLKISVSHLWEEFGSTEDPIVGFIINGSLGAVGLIGFWYFGGIVAYLCLMWAIINFGGILQWVVNQ